MKSPALNRSLRIIRAMCWRSLALSVPNPNSTLLTASVALLTNLLPSPVISAKVILPSSG